jgi:hypothetical protein
MPPFVRRRRGWDWFTPAEIKHLPATERQSIVAAAWKAVRTDTWPQRMVLIVLPVVGCLVVLAEVLMSQVPAHIAFLGWVIPISVLSVVFWRQRTVFRRTIRQQLWDAGIRPCFCFECGYYVEGFEGLDCPNCGTALIPPPPTG